MKILSFFTKAKNVVCKASKTLGPGFITGAADDDPSGIGTYSIAGAKYGLSMIWLVTFQLPLMFAIQEMCARIGLVTGKGLAANMKIFFPKSIVYAALALLAFANTVNIGADIAIMAESAKLIWGSSSLVWATVITFIVIAMEIFIPYKLYSKILMSTAVFLLAYVITALLTTTNWSEVLFYSFIPHIQFTSEYILIATGFVGTTISPYLFFWQTSQEVEELAGAKNVEQSRSSIIKKIRLDTFIGMSFSQLIALFIALTCFSTLHKHGLTDITSAYDTALALKPLAGEWAFLLFTAGIIGAGFLGIPVLAGATAYALSEIFNQPASLALTFTQAPFFYSVISLSTLLGLAMNFFNINAIKALLYAAVLNGIATVPFIAFIVILANKTEIMGKHKNSMLSNAMGGLTFGVMLASSILILAFF